MGLLQNIHVKNPKRSDCLKNKYMRYSNQKKNIPKKLYSTVHTKARGLFKNSASPFRKTGVDNLTLFNLVDIFVIVFVTSRATACTTT